VIVNSRALKYVKGTRKAQTLVLGQAYGVGSGRSGARKIADGVRAANEAQAIRVAFG
jgi:hypothetical protein